MSKQVYLVGVDGSEWSERAVKYAVSLAKQTGASVHLMHIVHWSGHTMMSTEGVVVRSLEKSQEEQNARDNILGPLVEKYKDSGVDITSDYTWGHPVEIMHDEIKKRHVNMVFAGRRGRSRVADLVMGSVSNSLAHITSVPIVLVP